MFIYLHLSPVHRAGEVLKLAARVTVLDNLPMERLKETRFRPLLITLVAMLLLHPALMELGLVRLLNLGWVAVLTLAIYCTGNLPRRWGRPWLLVLLVFLGLPTLCLRLVNLPFTATPEVLLMISTAIVPLFLTVVTAAVLRSVLAPGPVDREKIYGAISVYLMLGLIWSSLYAVVEILHPGAFAVPEGVMLLADKTAVDVLPGSEAGFLYYSFITLTTLGYGDIVPVSPAAQTLSWMEAAAGQLFLAVTIARLVGLSITHPGAASGQR